MIIEFFLNIVFGIISGILNAAPQISWNVDTSGFTFVKNILQVVCYLLPMPTVIAIVDIIIAITIFRFFISLGRTIWDLLPFA